MAYRVEFPPDIEKEAETSRGLSLPKNSGNSGNDGNDNQPSGNLQDAVKDVFSVNKPRQFELFVREAAPCPAGPVSVDRWLTILDPAKFVSATLADLASYVAGKNQGRRCSWIEDLLDEKIEQLRLCGVEAEIRTVQ